MPICFGTLVSSDRAKGTTEAALSNTALPLNTFGERLTCSLALT